MLARPPARRIAENACAATWPELRRQLDRIQVGAFTGTTGTFRQRTEISPAQAAILEQLGIDPPPKIYQLTPSRNPLTSGSVRPRYTPPTQERVRSSTSDHTFADQHATQLRNSGAKPTR